MAEKGVILSAEEEEKLLKPIDEYVGKIQSQIDELRADGSDKVRSLKNHIAIVKENKNLTKEEKAKLWSDRIQQYQTSGQTCKQWCTENGIPLSTMGYWIRRFAKEEPASESEQDMVLSDFHLNRKLPESCSLRNLHRCVFLFQTVSVLKYLIPADRN